MQHVADSPKKTIQLLPNLTHTGNPSNPCTDRGSCIVCWLLRILLSLIARGRQTPAGPRGIRSHPQGSDAMAQLASRRGCMSVRCWRSEDTEPLLLLLLVSENQVLPGGSAVGIG